MDNYVTERVDLNSLVGYKMNHLCFSPDLTRSIRSPLGRLTYSFSNWRKKNLSFCILATVLLFCRKLVEECTGIPGSLYWQISRTESERFFWDLPSRPCRSPQPAALTTACWWTSWAGCPLVQYATSEVTESSVWPLGIFRLRGACEVMQVSVPSSRLYLQCISTTVHFWQYSKANIPSIWRHPVNNGLLVILKKGKHVSDTVQVAHLKDKQSAICGLGLSLIKSQ